MAEISITELSGTAWAGEAAKYKINKAVNKGLIKAALFYQTY
jgi:hypothetical protein